jgi:phosphatidate cytidylyltransferase
LLYLGRIPFGFLVILLSLVGLVEFYTHWPAKNTFPTPWIGIIGGISFPILALIGYAEFFGQVLVLLILTSFLWQIFGTKRSRVGIDVGLTLLGAIYVGLFPSYLILLRDISHGWILVLLTILAVWICDVFAYAVGSLVGKRKLAPEISPNKTVAGAIAGLLASVGLLAGIYFLPWFSLTQRLFLGLLIGIFSQAGDLTASMLKRELGIKDFGQIIPGHGGVLDRFDGLFFVAPVVFYYFMI